MAFWRGPWLGGGNPMESGEFFNNPSGGESSGRASLWVKRGAYRRFNRWMDKQLADLVTRWGHLATPAAQRLSRSVRRSSKP
jgi:hypothetical protein